MDIDIGSRERSEAAKQAGESSAGPIRIDPNASAALEEAIRSAKLGLKPLPSPEVGTSEPHCNRQTGISDEVPEPGCHGAALDRRRLVRLLSGNARRPGCIRQLEAETARSQEILARLSTDLGALRETVVAFREVEHTSSTASVSEQTKLTDKVERLTISLQEPGKKLTALEGRLERMESQILTTLAGLNTNLAGLNAKPAAPAAPAAPPAPVEAAARKRLPLPSRSRASPSTAGCCARSITARPWSRTATAASTRSCPAACFPASAASKASSAAAPAGWCVTDKGFIGTYR